MLLFLLYTNVSLKSMAIKNLFMKLETWNRRIKIKNYSGF